MKISPLMTDERVLAEIGARLARQRLALNLTQAAVAQQAGVSKRTLERIESGGGAQLTSLVRILRVLELMDGLQKLLPETASTPMAQLQQKNKARVRASRKRKPASRSAANWIWQEDK